MRSFNLNLKIKTDMTDKLVINLFLMTDFK